MDVAFTCVFSVFADATSFVPEQIVAIIRHIPMYFTFILSLNYQPA